MQDGKRLEAFNLLYALNFLVKERPIVTRIWLFANCVRAMLRMTLLVLPPTIFTIVTSEMQEVNATRLKRFLKFYHGYRYNNVSYS